MGGLPGREEGTGRGVFTACRLAAESFLQKPPSDVTVALQGFGNVATHAAQFLMEAGARVVAVSGRRGGLYNPQGIDIPEAARTYVRQERSFAGLPGDAITNEELLALPVDILVPAAAGGAITRPLAERLRARLIVEGANDPVTADADPVMRAAGISDVPDILANAGGVIASYIEWRNAKSGSFTSKAEVYEFIDQVIERSFREVKTAADAKKITWRTASHLLALSEVVTAMRERAWV
jgi:glutamate dehydrogenase (NAD(P)+)